MTQPRRAFLHALALAGVGLTTGCVETTDALAGFAEGECETPPDTDPVRARGDDVAVTETIADEDVEYLPETSEVRYVAARRRVDDADEGETPRREPVYETVPFERWANVKSAAIASKHVREVVDATLTAEGVSAGVTTRDGTRVVVAELSYTCDRSNDVVASPPESLTLDVLTDAAPATVEVTFGFEGVEAMRSVPVFVRRLTSYDT